MIVLKARFPKVGDGRHNVEGKEAKRSPVVLGWN